MKRAIWYSAFTVALAFLLPLLLTPARFGAAPEAEQEVSGKTPAEAQPAAPAPLDASLVLTVHTEDGDRDMAMDEYLLHAMAGEMPADFGSEALKAQAVALRSYVLYYRERHKATHPEADICTSPGCCAAWLGDEALHERWGEKYGLRREKLEQAIRDTDGQYLAWQSSPILAVFHAASAGTTEAGESLGMVLPYLSSVSSPETPETVSGLNTTVEVSPEEFQSCVLGAFPDAKLDGGDPAAWLGPISLNATGRVESVEIGGQSVSGLTLRQMFALRSTDFSLSWDAAGKSFVFRVSGYGHGMGMSQHGANLMAKDGALYAEILAHYYPDTVLSTAAEAG